MGVMMFFTQCLKQDNKVMVNTAHSERPPPQSTALTITEPDSKPNSSQSTGLRCRRVRLSSILNIIIVITVVPLVILLEYGYIPGSKMGFTCKDPTLSHKFTGDTINLLTLGLGTTLVPMFVIVLVEVCISGSFKKIRLGDFWMYYKECLIGGVFVLLITEVAKVLIGEHRPHFFHVCDPMENQDCTAGDFIQTYTCTNKNYSKYFVIDSSRSFPSGHSSVAVFVALFSSYVVQKRLPTEKTGRLMKPFLVSACLTWGLLCSLSRIVDRRHHWWDVMGGMLIGAFGAYYTIYFLNKKLHGSITDSQRISTSTTTLLDVKNKGATSVMI